MAKKFKAALFDIDGTLLNTDQFIFQAFRHSLKSHASRDASWEEVSRVLGRPLAECYAIIEPSQDSEKLAQTHRSFQLDNLHLAVPFGGTTGVLKLLSEAGVKIAAVTTRHNDTLHKTLDLAGILSYFNAIVSADDVVRHKPHPEPVQKALELLSVSPRDAIMIGDSELDVLAGRQAGTKTIGVTYGFQGEKVRESNPDYVVSDIREVVALILK